MLFITTTRNFYKKTGPFWIDKNNSGRRITLQTQQTVAAVKDVLQKNPRVISCWGNGFEIEFKMAAMSPESKASSNKF